MTFGLGCTLSNQNNPAASTSMIPMIPNTVAFSKPALVAAISESAQSVGDRNDAALPVVW